MGCKYAPDEKERKALTVCTFFFQVKISLSCESAGMKFLARKLQLLILRKVLEFLEWFGLPPIIRLVCFLTRKAARKVMVCS